MIGVPDMKAVATELKGAGHTGIGEALVAPRAKIPMIRDPDGNQIGLLGPGGS